MSPFPPPLFGTNASSGPSYGPELPSSSGSGYGGLAGVGNMLMIFGAAQSAIGAFYGVKSAQYEARSKASSLEFEATLANLNARNAETNAQYALEAGQRAAGRVSLEYAQVKGNSLAEQAAHGLQVGVGSSAEILASADYAKQSDMLTIDANAVRNANLYRREAVNQNNAAMLDRVSARNLRSGAKAMNPWLAGASSLLGSAGPVASSWAAGQRQQMIVSSLQSR
jgi:hypothetical protein